MEGALPTAKTNMPPTLELAFWKSPEDPLSRKGDTGGTLSRLIRRYSDADNLNSGNMQRTQSCSVDVTHAVRLQKGTFHINILGNVIQPLLNVPDARMHSSAYDIVALRDDVLPVEQLGAFLPLQTPVQPFRVVASKSRSFSALALTDEVETAGCCHPTCKNVGATSVQSRCSVDSCSAVVVPAPGDEVSPEICELSGVALSLLQKLCARRNYTLQDEV